MSSASAPLPDWARTAAPAEGKPADDRGEDDQRHPVADAPLRDQLAHPHEQRGAGGQRQHDEQDAGRMVKLGTRSKLDCAPWKKPPPPLWNTKTRPVDCMMAMATVR